MPKHLFGTAFSVVPRYWRGGYSLVLTIVVFLVALRLALYMLQANFLQQGSFVSSIVWVLIAVSIAFWQLRGASKAVDQSMSYSGDMVTVYLCYLSMALVTVLTVLQAVDAMAALAKARDPLAQFVDQNAQLLAIEGDVVQLQGDLDFVSNNQLRATLEHDANIKTLQLHSEGGRVFAARALAITVEHYKLNTHVESICHSACTLVFIAGAKRTMTPTAQLGFHRYRHQSKQPGVAISIDDQLQKDQQEFLRRGVQAEFVDKMFKSDGDSLWLPKQKELESAGVLNTSG